MNHFHRLVSSTKTSSCGRRRHRQQQTSCNGQQPRRLEVSMFALSTVLLFSLGSLSSLSPCVVAASVPRGYRRSSLQSASSATTSSFTFEAFDSTRHLQNKNDKDKDEADGKEDKNQDKQDKDATASPSVTPTQTPTMRPTPRPTVPTTAAPTSAEPTVAPADVDDSVLTALSTNLGTSTNTAQAHSSASSTAAETTATTTSIPEKDAPLSQTDIRDIQYQGGGEITLRFSLKFRDPSDSSGSPLSSITSESVTGSVERAVLQTMQQWLCQTPRNYPEDDESILGFAVAAEEERELCVVKTKLEGGGQRDLQEQSTTNSSMDGSILMQPPTLYVVDRENVGARWTTWRLTWSVLRLGTFYIRQGLENMDPSASTTAASSSEELYRAGVQAMQQVLDLALQVHIRDRVLDKVLEATLLAEDSPALAISSVYGEELSTFGPQDFVSNTNEVQPEGDGPAAEASDGTDHDDTTADDEVQDREEDDDEWDDDRYSEEYGITEQLNPPFWHPLRIIGMAMFVFTIICLVTLTCLSRRRQKQLEQERKMMRDQGQGLLNNPQGVEDMLRLSVTKKGPNPSAAKDQELGDGAPSDEDEDDEKLDIPMPSNLKMK